MVLLEERLPESRYERSNAWGFSGPSATYPRDSKPSKGSYVSTVSRQQAEMLFG